MNAQTKTYDIQVTNDIPVDYDFVLSAYYTDNGATIRARILAEMSDFFERVMTINSAVVSFVEVTR